MLRECATFAGKYIIAISADGNDVYRWFTDGTVTHCDGANRLLASWPADLNMTSVSLSGRFSVRVYDPETTPKAIYVTNLQ